MSLKQKFKGLFSKEMFFVYLIVLLAFAIRAHLFKYELFFEFDSYYHARLVSYLLQGMGLPASDPLAYYQLGGGWLPDAGLLFWYVSAALYAVTGGVFSLITTGTFYNKEIWIQLVKFLPAFYGALIAGAMYFLGKEMYNKKAGYIMGIFAATIPAFVYRTMAGFFEDDSLGFLPMIIGLIFLVKAIKQPEWTKQKMIYAAVAGIFFGIMAWTWGLFLLVPIIIGFFGVSQIVVMLWKKADKKEIKAFAGLLFIAFAIFSIMATAMNGSIWAETSFNYVTGYFPLLPGGVEKATARGEGVFAQTVGEENTGIQYFGTKYNAMVLLAYLGALLVLWRLLKNKNENHSLIIFFWIAITFYMAFSKLKFTYTFGLPIAAGAGVVFFELEQFLRGKQVWTKRILGVLAGIMILTTLAAGTHFMLQNTPTIEESEGWKPALEWMRVESPENTKFFNWWDQGHWITFIGERSVLLDNRNLDLDADQDYGRFALMENEQEAYELVKKYGSSHVIVSKDLLTKSSSMAVYAYLSTDFSDPRLNRYFGRIFNCGREVDNLQQKVIYTCGSNVFQEQQLLFYPTQWSPNANQIIENNVPLFLYRDKDNQQMFMFNAASNNIMTTKLWFNDPSITHFKEVYANPGVKIFKVID
jgi:asparagine N-glycosylation enzyme membrane subunit Stt3